MATAIRPAALCLAVPGFIERAIMLDTGSVERRPSIRLQLYHHLRHNLKRGGRVWWYDVGNYVLLQSNAI
jgi:hypothetical protein